MIIFISYVWYTHLDWNRRVGPVRVIQVDAAHSQPLERALTRLFDILGASVDRPIGIESESKLSSQEDIVPLSTAFEPVRVIHGSDRYRIY